MIEIKKISGLTLNKWTAILDDVTLNSGTSPIFYFNNQPILFMSIQNNAGVDFSSFIAKDHNNNDLTHNCQIHNGCYSIAFSGTSVGQPLQTAQLSALNIITFDFVFPGVAIGNLIINIYTFAL